MKNQSLHLSAEVYNAQEASFLFPEDQLESLKGKESLGITFSGGGTRSASLSMGQLRALNQIGVLQRAKYMSGVSGGSWATVPFTFLDTAISDQMFLGTYVSPNDITLEMLREVPKYSLTYAIVNSKIRDKILPNIDFNHDLYSRIISQIFLYPFNLGNAEKFFTYNQQTLEEVLSKNTELGVSDFYLVNPQNNRPYYIAGGSLLRPDFNRYQFEMTPLYVGVNQLFKNAGSDGKYDIGGGYVSSYGFNTDSPGSQAGSTVDVRLSKDKDRFNLGDIVGVSGAAPAEYADRLGLENIGFPKFKYWCNFNNPVKTQPKEYSFGDGGILENLGIMPLLKRKVQKIIVFVNGSTPIAIKKEKGKETIQISDSIPALFMPLKNLYGAKNFDDNIVFANQLDKYNLLVQDLLDKIKNGHAPIHINTYHVTKQPHYNISEEYDVKVMWVYNAPVADWENQLSIDAKHLLNNDKMFENFPYYRTFLQNPPEIIQLKPEQANMAAHLSSWIIESNRVLFDEFLASNEIV
jgi:hypothetical protein